MSSPSIEQSAPSLQDLNKTRYQITRKITLVGAAINLVLAIAKILVGLFGHSQALVADGIHSLSDLATDALVLIGAKHGSREADSDHPYGHGRIETALTVGLGILLILVAAGLIYDAILRLFQPNLLEHPDNLVLGIAALSVVSKELLYHYTMFAAKQTRSNLLRANAWHHRSDAISSIVVIVGVVGTMAGLTYLDAIAAVVVALMIVKIGWELSWNNVRELVDTALDKDRVELIRKNILSVSGVRALHMLRTRRMGGDALVDVHILVDPKVSVSEGHQISERVLSGLVRDIEEVTDVTVHIDPEDDEVSRPSGHLPLRKELLTILTKHWKEFEEARHIEDITLHYLDGRVHVELKMPLAIMDSVEKAEKTKRKFALIADKEENIADVRVCFF